MRFLQKALTFFLFLLACSFNYSSVANAAPPIGTGGGLFTSFVDFANNYQIAYDGDKTNKSYHEGDLIHVKITDIPGDQFMADNGVVYDLRLIDHVASSLSTESVIGWSTKTERVGYNVIHVAQPCRPIIVNHDSVWSTQPSCTQEANGTYTISGAIDTSKLFQHTQAISRDFKLVIDVAATEGNSFAGADSSQRLTNIPEDIEYYNVTSKIKPNPCFTVDVIPSKNVLPNSTVTFIIHNAVRGYKNSDDCSNNSGGPNGNDVKARYMIGLLNASGNIDNTLQPDGILCPNNTQNTDCIVSYRVPATDSNGKPFSADNIQFFIAGHDYTIPNSSYDQNSTDTTDDFINGRNVVFKNITLDSKWSAILTSPNWQDLVNQCQFGSPVPKCSPDDISTSVTPMACHSHNNNAFACDKTNSYACKDSSGKIVCKTLPNFVDSACATDGLITTTPDPKGNTETFCNKTQTALGDIETTPQGITQFLFALLLGLAGMVALLLIVMSGYRVMTSQGNEEAIKEAKEQLTSAIIGLLFIIFSMVIFQIITRDLLHIPGFN